MSVGVIAVSDFTIIHGIGMKESAVFQSVRFENLHIGGFRFPDGRILIPASSGAPFLHERGYEFYSLSDNLGQNRFAFDRFSGDFPA